MIWLLVSIASLTVSQIGLCVVCSLLWRQLRLQREDMESVSDRVLLCVLALRSGAEISPEVLRRLGLD